MEIRNQNSSFLLELTAKLFVANSFFFLHTILIIFLQQEINVRSTDFGFIILDFGLKETIRVLSSLI